MINKVLFHAVFTGTGALFALLGVAFLSHFMSLDWAIPLSSLFAGFGMAIGLVAFYVIDHESEKFYRKKLEEERNR